MSVNDLLFRLKLDPGQFSKSLKDMATGVDNLSKKKLSSLENGLKHLTTTSVGLQRKIDMMGEAVTKADRRKLAKLKVEFREVEKAAKRTKGEIDGITSATSRAARTGDRLRGFGNRLSGAGSRLGGSLGGGAKELGSRAINAMPGGGIVAGLAGGGMGLGLAGGGLLAGGLALGAGAAGLGMFAKGGIAAARDGQRIDTGLKQQLDAQGAGDRFGELDSLSGSIQKAMNLDDEATREGFTEFLKRGFNVDDIRKNASLIGDIAKDKQIDYKSAAELVAKGLSGEGRAMKELGLATSGDRVRDAATFQEQAQSKYGGAGAKLAGAEGPMVAAKLAIDDIQQSLGDKLIPFVDKIGAQVVGILDRLQADGTMDRIINGASVFIEMVFSSVSWIIDAFTGLTVYLQNFNWSDIIDGMLTLLVEGAIAGVKNVWALLEGLVKTGWNFITNGIPALGALILEMLLKTMDKIPGLKTLISDDSIKGAEIARGEAMDKAFSAQGSILKDTFGRIGNNLGTAFEAAAGEDGFNVAQTNGTVATAAKAVAASDTAYQQTYGMAAYSGASQLARQDNAFKAEKAAGKGKGNNKLAQAVDKYNNGGRTMNLRITSADAHISPVSTY